MKTALTISLAILTAGVPATAYLGQIIKRFPAPLGGLDALATDGTYLYGLKYLGGGDRIYKIAMSNGSVVSSFYGPFQETAGLGYEYGGYLWAGRVSAGPSRPALLARCSASTGSIYSSFRVTAHHMFGGVACQGVPDRPGTLRAIISNDSLDVRVVSRHTPAGSLISTFSFSPPLHKSNECGWDYVNNLVWLPYSYSTWPAPYVYGFTTDGSVVASFRPPLIITSGVTYYSGYLWVSNVIWSPMDIFQLHCPDMTAVAPASLGRVKALFR